jgi:septal ring factor EnvC (AmiA/AmiB activator)
MTRTALVVRRSTTLVAVLLVVALGFLAIRVAAAWTANAAPLEVAPPAVETLQAQLDAERSRSAQLSVELHRLMAQSADLNAALVTAQAQIAKDADHATELSKDLATAKRKLRSLEKSIRAARAALARQPTVTVRTVATTSTSTTGEHEEHEDAEEHDDD